MKTVACVAVFCFCRGRRGHCAMGHRAPRWCNFLGRTRSRDSYDLRVAPLPKTCLVQFCSCIVGLDVIWELFSEFRRKCVYVLSSWSELLSVLWCCWGLLLSLWVCQSVLSPSSPLSEHGHRYAKIICCNIRCALKAWASNVLVFLNLRVDWFNRNKTYCISM